MTNYDHLRPEWIAQYKEGTAINALSIEYNVSTYIIRKEIKDHVTIRRRIPVSEKTIQEWIALHNMGFSIKEISKKVGSSTTTVQRKLLEKGVIEVGERNKYGKYTKEWQRLYEEGKSLEEIADMYGCGRTTVTTHLCSVMEIKTVSEALRKNFLQDDYFEKINDVEKAYWLGYAFATVSFKLYETHPVLIFTTSSDKKDTLQELKEILQCKDKKIHEYVLGTVTLRLDGVKIIEDLQQKGIQEHDVDCSFIQSLPNELFFAFLRGYFKEKGFVHKETSAITLEGSPTFLYELQQLLIEKYPFSLELEEKDVDTFYMHIYQQDSIHTFLKWLEHPKQECMK